MYRGGGVTEPINKLNVINNPLENTPKRLVLLNRSVERRQLIPEHVLFQRTYFISEIQFCIFKMISSNIYILSAPIPRRIFIQCFHQTLSIKRQYFKNLFLCFQDYGNLFCIGENLVGGMTDPCVYQILPTGKETQKTKYA